MRTTLVDWDKFDYYVNRLAKQIKKSGWKPAYICGLPRGGLPLAVALSHKLDVPFIEVADLSSGKTLGKHLLVCDDISDTGKQLNTFKKHYGGIAEIRTATLLERRGTQCPVDFKGTWIRETLHHPHYAWIIFPWEV